MNSVYCNVQYTVQFICITIVSGFCIGNVLFMFGTLKENATVFSYVFAFFTSAAD